MNNKLIKLKDKIKELEAKVKKYEKLLIENNIDYTNNYLDKQSNQTELTTQEKITIYMDYFKGRMDCFAIRWEKDDKSGYAPSYKKEVRYLTKEQKKKITFDNLYEPFSENILFEHLKGFKTIGIYPILDDQTCYFLAFDFDDKNFINDINNVSSICNEHNISHLIETSRSGKGAHLWIFFETPILAKDARKLGRYLLTKTMMTYGLKTFKSYDRMFPAQDYIEQNGIGNLIALPLQGKSGQKGNTLFVDNNFKPYNDQYQVLKNTKKITSEEVNSLLDKISKENEMGLFNETAKNIPIDIFDFPNEVVLTFKNQIHISKSQLSPKAIQYFKRIASVVNPEFYKKQNMRISTYGIARIIELYEEKNDELLLPNGTIETLKKGLDESRIIYKITDLRVELKITNNIKFVGALTNEQEEVLKEVIKKPNGVVIAPTGFGKTVLGISLIIKLKLKTLIIVNRVNLAKQWVSQIKKYSSNSDIGKFYENNNNLGYDIDIATIQSLSTYSDINKITKSYGLIIIDEVHHLASVSYERLIRKFHAKNIVGLTATLKRSDGLENIVTTMIGPVIKEVSVDSKNLKRKLTVRLTGFKLSSGALDSITDAYQELYENEERNKMIIEDIKTAFKTEKNILILTDRIAHLKILEKEITNITNHLFVIHGRLSIKEKRLFNENLKNQKKPFIILATGKFIGEGFDDDRLDTLFLTMPFKWKGTLQQYVGRLNRENHDKHEINVYDYADIAVNFFSNMYLERLKGYRRMGYEVETSKTFNSKIFKFDNYEDELKIELKEAKHVKFIIKQSNKFKIDVLLKSCKVIPEIVNEDDCPANIIIIDKRIVWYGSINPFSFKQTIDGDIMRYDDSLLAKELSE